MKYLAYDVTPEDLKELRKEALDPDTGIKGLSQSRFADLLGLSVISIKKYEAGDAMPSLEVLFKMSELSDAALIISHKNPHPVMLKRQEQGKEAAH